MAGNAPSYILVVCTTNWDNWDFYNENADSYQNYGTEWLDWTETFSYASVFWRHW